MFGLLVINFLLLKKSIILVSYCDSNAANQMAHESIGQLGSALLILAVFIYTPVVSFRAAALGFRDFFFLSKLFENLLVPSKQKISYIIRI